MIQKLLLYILVFFSMHASASFLYTIKIQENEIQAKVTSMMPIQRSKYFLTVILSDSKVNLIKESNQIALASPVVIMGPAGLKVAGFVKIQGILSYEANSGEFFLENPTIVDFQVSALPSKYQNQVKSIIQLAAAGALRKNPIYKLNDENLKHRLAKSILNSVTVKDQILLVELSIL